MKPEMTKEEFLAKYYDWYRKNTDYIDKRKMEADNKIRLFLSLYGSRELLEKMEIMDYAFQTNGRKDSLCFLIDYGTDILGINRVNSQSGYQRYGIQLSEDGNNWYPFCKKDKPNTSKHGADQNSVFKYFKEKTIELLEACKTNDDEKIEKIDMPQLHKNKLHFIYTNGQSIPIYVKPDLLKILNLFGISVDLTKSIFYMRKRLYQLLLSFDRPDITPWHFMQFMYEDYRLKSLLKKKQITKTSFNAQIKKQRIDLNTPVTGNNNVDDCLSVGKRGESVVYEYLQTHRKELHIKKNSVIYRVCDKPITGVHCDFIYTQSVDGVDKNIYIEAKATRQNDPNGIHFKMSIYEKIFMNENSNSYFIYYVNDVYNQNHIIQIKPEEIRNMIEPFEYLANCKIVNNKN